MDQYFKRMKQFVLIFLIVTSLGYSACRQKSVESQMIDDLNKKYKSIKEFFGDKMINHFPKQVDSNIIEFTETLSPELGNLDFFYTNRISGQPYEWAEEFEKKSIISYNADDTCLLVVNRHLTKDRYYKIKLTNNELKSIDLPCYIGKYPIPNFWHTDYVTETTTCKLPSDFRIYVMEADSGKYFEQKYLTDGSSMPKEWKNGFSKGVAISINRNVIIYWVIIW